MKFIRISSMPIDENITLKKNLKLKVKLPQPKSQVENITSSCFKSQVVTSSCFKSNVIGKFANTTGGTCGHESSLKDPNNNNTNPKCESATSKRLGNPAAYPKGSFGDMKSRCSRDNAFSEASSAKLQRDVGERPDYTGPAVDDEEVYYKVAGECPKGRVYDLSR
ncbi:hypothetical protein Scep_017149 [Stephania cephalantha]|uniref:Uncharacterized protein n=1 Tax=Stephania cephalantha TaxID=152367 RepID=A0AAP0IQS6_9MAGN